MEMDIPTRSTFACSLTWRKRFVFVLGAKLPPERQLAEQLQASRTTVTNAYRELEAKGLVRGYVGRGTYSQEIQPLL